MDSFCRLLSGSCGKGVALLYKATVSLSRGRNQAGSGNKGVALLPKVTVSLLGVRNQEARRSQRWRLEIYPSCPPNGYKEKLTKLADELEAQVPFNEHR